MKTAEFERSIERNKEAQRLKEHGMKDVNKYSTVRENKSVYIVSWQEPTKI